VVDVLKTWLAIICFFAFWLSLLLFIASRGA
jgi:hypothetical protein